MKLQITITLQEPIENTIELVKKIQSNKGELKVKDIFDAESKIFILSHDRINSINYGRSDKALSINNLKPTFINADMPTRGIV